MFHSTAASAATAKARSHTSSEGGTEAGEPLGGRPAEKGAAEGARGVEERLERSAVGLAV